MLRIAALVALLSPTVCSATEANQSFRMADATTTLNGCLIDAQTNFNHCEITCIPSHADYTKCKQFCAQNLNAARIYCQNSYKH